MHGTSELTFSYLVSDLLTKLKVNRKTHAENYNKAIGKYRDAQTNWLTKNLAKAKEGRTVETAMNFPRPVNYVSEYDRVIGMFEMTTEKEVKLDARLFSQLVQDRWDWKSAFESSTMCYTGATGSCGPTGVIGFDGDELGDADDSLQEIKL